MEVVKENLDTGILLAPAMVAVYLIVVLESYLLENTAFSYVFQM